MHAVLAGSGWLIVGGAAALLAWSGWADGVLVALDGVLPGAWRRTSVGLLLFAACAAIYFRSHWAVTAGLLRRSTRAPHASRLRDAAGDLERSAHVIVDNLAEVRTESGTGGGELYLEGARAHAERLAVTVQRVRAVAQELEPQARDD